MSAEWVVRLAASVVGTVVFLIGMIYVLLDKMEHAQAAFLTAIYMQMAAGRWQR